MTSDNTFDLSTLEGFDVSRASNWVGGTVEGTILTFNDKNGKLYVNGKWAAGYTYDCGNGFTAEVYLWAFNPPITATVTLYDAPPENQGLVVKQLYQDASGDYSWETDEDEGATPMIMALEVHNNDENVLITSFEVKLSEGFSFSSEETVSTKQMTLSETTQTFYETVYPVNVEKITEALVVKVVKDDYEDETKFTIEQRDKGEINFPGSSMYGFRAHSDTFEMNWVDELLESNANRYSQSMAEFCLDFSLAGRQYDLLLDAFRSWRFKDWKYNAESYTGIESTFVHRKIVTSDDPINLVMVVVNQPDEYTWGNWIVTSMLGENALVQPALFDSDADRIVNRLFEYLVEHEMYFNNTAILVCGRNNGGAVANVITHRLHTTYHFLKVKGYTFGTPNVTSTEPAIEANLFNYCYAHDPVTMIPKRFYKFGQTFYVGAGEGAPASVASKFVDYTYTPYEKPESRVITGMLLMLEENKISMLQGVKDLLASLFLQTNASILGARANATEHYMAWLKGNGISGAMSLDELREAFIVEESVIRGIQGAQSVKSVADSAKTVTEAESIVDKIEALFDIYDGIGGVRDATTDLWNNAKHAVLSFFSCPVDVTLYDGSWQKVAEFRNHRLVKAADSNLARTWEDVESDIIAMPLSRDYVTYIVGNDEGTMNVSTGVFKEDGALARNDVFLEVPIHTGNAYLSGYLYNVAADGGWSSYLYAVDEHLLYLNGSVYARETFALPASLGALSEESFAGSAAISGLIVIPEGVTAIESGAFAGTGVAAVVLEGSDTAIADDAFDDDGIIYICRADSLPAKWAKQRELLCVELPW